MNLIRDLLLFHESDGTIPYPTANDDTIAEHLILMVEAGLLSGTIHLGTLDSGPMVFSNGGRTAVTDNGEYSIFPLTWKGHDFIAAARDNNRWKAAMQSVGKFTFEIIKEYLQKELRTMLGLI
jgi:hypothetical protein